MFKGKVCWFSKKRGYGFVTDSEGRGEFFVHWTDINSVEEFKTLQKGETVVFDVIDTEKGRQAINVTVIAE